MLIAQCSHPYDANLTLLFEHAKVTLRPQREPCGKQAPSGAEAGGEDTVELRARFCSKNFLKRAISARHEAAVKVGPQREMCDKQVRSDADGKSANVVEWSTKVTLKGPSNE